CAQSPTSPWRPSPLLRGVKRKPDSSSWGHCASSSRLEVKMDITEVAKRSGIPASTLRFYEEKGLIASAARRGLRRVFGGGVLERLALLALGRAAGFSLDEIAGMFAPDGKPRSDRQMLAAKAAELGVTIRDQ